jgi:hypothetical protein
MQARKQQRADVLNNEESAHQTTQLKWVVLKEPPSRTRRLKEVHKQPPQYKNKFQFRSVKIG